MHKRLHQRARLVFAQRGVGRDAERSTSITFKRLAVALLQEALTLKLGHQGVRALPVRSCIRHLRLSCQTILENVINGKFWCGAFAPPCPTTILGVVDAVHELLHRKAPRLTPSDLEVRREQSRRGHCPTRAAPPLVFHLMRGRKVRPHDGLCECRLLDVQQGHVPLRCFPAAAPPIKLAQLLFCPVRKVGEASSPQLVGTAILRVDLLGTVFEQVAAELVLRGALLVLAVVHDDEFFEGESVRFEAHQGEPCDNDLHGGRHAVVEDLGEDRALPRRGRTCPR
mmetsp:Transcript_76641/g.212996  ORF Transcript_76641/g.212996 Transcript_76641/m.212996 type:complete len:283 (+) Transcript_76641:449-1297(+)